MAKNQFKDMPQSHGLLRGKSETPLWITAVGITTDDAQIRIASMAGAFRLPDMIKRVDQLARADYPFKK